MWGVKYFICYFMFTSAVKCWNIAVTSENNNGVQFYTTNGTKEWEFTDIPKVTAIHYDLIFDVLFMVNDGESIHIMDMKSRKYKQVLQKADGKIVDITFDPVTKKIFWTDLVKTDGSLSKIAWTSLEDGGRGYIAELTQKPWGIAVDSCDGQVYWSKELDGFSSVERADLLGENITVIRTETPQDGNIVYGLYINQDTGKLFWTHDLFGYHYSIDSYDLRNGNITLVYQATHQVPMSLAVDDEFIYWTDHSERKTITKLSKNDYRTVIEMKIPATRITAKSERLELVPNSKCSSLNALIGSNVSLSFIFDNTSAMTENKCQKACIHGYRIDDECKCYLGYTGDKCEISLCHNYCLNDGVCRIRLGLPYCSSCKAGFEGAKCEKAKCHNYCVEGVCEINPTGDPTCRCFEGYSGDRCESNTTVVNLVEATISMPSVEPYWMYATAALASICGVLTLSCVALSVKYLRLRRRPKIKKRIIVNRNVTPLTDSRPDPQHCEITIENCCNMNICETPCFEPRSLRSASKDRGKEEKRNLIMNMENADDI